MIPSKIKIESFANRCHMGTLGGKGLSTQDVELLIASNTMQLLYSTGQEIVFSYIVSCRYHLQAFSLIFSWDSHNNAHESDKTSSEHVKLTRFPNLEK